MIHTNESKGIKKSFDNPYVVVIFLLLLIAVIVFLIIILIMPHPPTMGSIRIYDEPKEGEELRSPSDIDLSDAGDSYILYVQLSGKSLSTKNSYHDAEGVLVTWSGATQGSDTTVDGYVTIDLTLIHFSEEEVFQILTLEFRKSGYITETIELLIVR